MQRVDTLLQKLQTQFAAGAGTAALLLTVQQLAAELLHLQSEEGTQESTANVTVVMPSFNANAGIAGLAAVAEIAADTTPALPAAIPEAPQAEEKVVQILQVDEAEIAAELEEMKRNAAARNNMSLHVKPVVFEETEQEKLPTRAYQPAPVKELNEVITTDNSPSLNDQLKQASMALGDQLTEAPVRDLRKAIGINDRFLYINELFRGDENMYERSIKTINGFSILPEAEYWIQRELKVKLGWSDANETVKQFNQLVKRRFS